MTQANPHPGGWRAAIRTRAAGLLPNRVEPGLVADLEPLRGALDEAIAPRPPRPHPAIRLAEWFGATEARRYEDALAALLDLRREILVSGAGRGDYTVAAAHVPELAEEVKRLVSTDEPCFDAYLRLLHRILAAANAPTEAVPTPVALPAPGGSSA